MTYFLETIAFYENRCMCLGLSFSCALRVCVCLCNCKSQIVCCVDGKMCFCLAAVTNIIIIVEQK